MPIYMDRHDLSENVTAEIVAQLHQEDLKIQDQYGCRGLTYWFDEKRKTAFCLVEAPDMGAIEKMHNQAHGQVGTSIIEVEASIVESFLGRIEDPEKAADAPLNIINDPGFRTIMVIALQHVKPDLKIDKKFNQSPDQATNAILGILKEHQGQPVKHSDNYFQVSFNSVTNALHAALAVRAIFDEDAGNDPGTVRSRIGVNAGIPVTEKKSIFEDTVKLAERMCMVINAGIIVSSEVMDLYKSENPGGSTGKENLYILKQPDEILLTGLMDYMSSAWNNCELKVDDFSRSLGFSKSQLYRKLVWLTGKSPNSFIMDYRLNEAFKLLQKSIGNVSEIAFETGFTSPSYFTKCFQKKYGVLPSYYLQLRSGLQ